jgi:hypothetical protein
MSRRFLGGFGGLDCECARRRIEAVGFLSLGVENRRSDLIRTQACMHACKYC